MKLSTNWLREHVDINVSLDQIADRLTMAGLEVEESKSVSGAQFAAAGGEGLSGDVVFDVKVTPNRGDWLSVIGVAREAAPLVDSKMRLPQVDMDGFRARQGKPVPISIQDPDLCRRYVGIVIRNVKIGESPGWMKDRLIAAGMRPINNAVDITNYVMLELGQPLHAFDLSLLHGPEIVVRRARPGETITSIDGEIRALADDMLVIADRDRPVAIAGVMGGAESEINDSTTDILLESANFDPVSVRRTSKRLGMTTESSYRFERGVDPSISDFAAVRAIELLSELAGGVVDGGINDVYPEVIKPLTISLRPQRANDILGLDIAPESILTLLNGLGLASRVVDGTVETAVPTFRPDITTEIDLIEEVGRAYGYDKMPMTLPAKSMQGRDNILGRFKDKLARVLISCGMQEAMTNSMIEGALVESFGGMDGAVVIRNPLSEELNAMRTMLVPNLLEVLARNQAYGMQNVSVFEIGNVYFTDSAGEPDERLSVAGAMAGSIWGESWNLPAESFAADFFTCKGVVETLLERIGIVGATFEKAQRQFMHPTRTAEVFVDGRPIGILGEVLPQSAEGVGVKGRSYVFELSADALMLSVPERVVVMNLPRFPALSRHMAMVVSDDIPCAALLETVRGAGAGILERVGVLDEFRSDKIGEGSRSIAISMVFRSSERTLTDEEANDAMTSIREALIKDHGVSFR